MKEVSYAKFTPVTVIPNVTLALFWKTSMRYPVVIDLAMRCLPILKAQKLIPSQRIASCGILPDPISPPTHITGHDTVMWGIRPRRSTTCRKILQNCRFYVVLRSVLVTLVRLWLPLGSTSISPICPVLTPGCFT